MLELIAICAVIAFSSFSIGGLLILKAKEYPSLDYISWVLMLTLSGFFSSMLGLVFFIKCLGEIAYA